MDRSAPHLDRESRRLRNAMRAGRGKCRAPVVASMRVTSTIENKTTNIEDNFPNNVPVSSKEIDVIINWLGPLLAETLRERR